MIGHVRRHTILSVLAGAVALLLGLGQVAWAQTPGGSGGFYFFWDVMDERGQLYTGQNVQCSVFRTNVHAAILLHGGATGIGAAAVGRNPLWSDANGKFHFYSSASDPVDVTCYYDLGGGGFSGRIDRFTHRIVLPRGGVQISRFAARLNAGGTAYQSLTPIYLPSGALVRDVIVHNLNPYGGATTFHISVGFAGDHAIGISNALLHTLPLTSPDEWLRGHAQVTAAGGQRFYYSANHRGMALMRWISGHISGSGAAPTGGAYLFPGVYEERPYLIHVATGLRVTWSGAAPARADLETHVYILWQKFHTPTNALPFGAGR